MGWGYCGTDSEGRPIGYSHSATCDHPSCTAAIDRGLSYACGDMHGQTEFGCEKYFCPEHLKNFIYDECNKRWIHVCAECYDTWHKNISEEYGNWDDKTDFTDKGHVNPEIYADLLEYADHDGININDTKRPWNTTDSTDSAKLLGEFLHRLLDNLPSESLTAEYIATELSKFDITINGAGK